MSRQVVFNMAKGFTLFELLISIAISSMVATGLFSIFSAVSSVRDRSVTQSENTIVIEVLTNLINRDTRMMISDSIKLDTSHGEPRLIMTTNNSLRFNKALPVEITYYIDEGWLWRREVNTDLLYDMEMKLLPASSDLKVEFFDGDEYQDEVIANSKVIRISLNVNNAPIKILAARTVDSVK